MPLSQPQTIFGICTLTAYDPVTRLPLGEARVLGSAELASTGELINLNGGCNKYPWKVERGLISSELTVTLREYPPFLFETLLGKAMTTNAAEAGGSVTPLTNAQGTSVVDATTGIASVSVVAGSEADVKFAGYVVRAVTATTVDVYAYTDLDFAQGTDATFIDDALKITATPLTITTATPVTVPDFGVELTGGSGAIALVADDTATFTARPINNGSQEVVVGSSTEVFNDFGLIITAQRPGDKEMTIIDCYRVAGAGLPINLTENEFSEASITMNLFRDSVRDGVYSFRRVKSVN